MNQSESKGQPADNGMLSRRRFLLVSGASATGLGLGVLNLAGITAAGRPAASRSGQPMIVGMPNQASPGDETALAGSVDSGATLKLANMSQTPKSSALRVDIEGDVYQRSGIWVRSKATVVDTVVGLFVENVGLGDGIYVENTGATTRASGIAVVNRSDSIGLNCLQDSSNTFFHVLKDPEHEGTFGDLMSFKDLRLSSPPFNRTDDRAFWIGGDGRMRTRVGVGNAEGVQLKRNEQVPAGEPFKDVVLGPGSGFVPEPDRDYGVVATALWNTSVWVSNKEPEGFRLHFGTASPGPPTGEVCWILFRDTL